MNKIILIMALIVAGMAGCSFLDKYVVPPQVDEAGNVIPGSRQPTALVQGVADVVPYGNVALNIFLLGLAGFEKFRSYKLGKGLKSTLQAGKNLSNDPEMAKLWEKIKLAYKQEHENAGVTSLIKNMLSKLPSTVT